MRRLLPFLLVAASAVALPVALTGQTADPKPDWTMVAKIREEGLQRSQVMDTVSYIADVLGARLTLSDDMARAQVWVESYMKKIGLVNTAIEPFMDYGTRWDNEYTSLHMLEPDYQPMVGYPISHTPGTDGKKTKVTYYLADNQLSKDFHENICKKIQPVTVTGTCKKEGDKLVLTCSKAEAK